MILFCKNIFIFFSLFCFSINAISQWPYIAIPFSYSPQGGFFFSVQSYAHVHEHTLARTAIMPRAVFSVSCDKKTLQLNGQKIIHHDVTLWGKGLTINGNFVSEAVHCLVDSNAMKGFFIIQKKGYKYYGYNRYMATLLDVDSAFISWHSKKQNIGSDLEHTFECIQQKQPTTVRVLLSKADRTSAVRWKFTSQKGFWIHSLGKDISKKIFCKEAVIVSLRHGHMFCNGKKVDHGITIKPLCEHAEFDGTSYDGFFSLVPDKNSVLCINHVDLEDYIVAVLRTESWPGWPLEVNKAFAITCRSYVAAKMAEAYKADALFHVKNTNAHQTYQGKHDITVLKSAVAQTRGVVLGFNQKPILAMFDSCCGGVIPAHIADFDFNKVPYLARAYACNHCKYCSLYSWVVSYDWHDFQALMKQHDKKMHKIYDVRVSKKDKAGVVLEVQLRSIHGATTISGKQLYSLLKDVKSFHFDIHKKAGKITVSGRGFGHHIGLCQWGARQMVRDGWDYKSILQFYYPQTYFMRLS